MCFFVLVICSGKNFAQNGSGSIHPNAVKLDYDRFLFIADGAIGIKKGDKYALVNVKGEFIVPWGKYEFQHSDIEVNEFGLIKVRNQHPIEAPTNPYRTGYINTKGKVVIPVVYARAGFDLYGIGKVAEIVKTPKSNIIREMMPYVERFVHVNFKGVPLRHFDGHPPAYNVVYGPMVETYRVDSTFIPVKDSKNMYGFIDRMGRRKTVFFDPGKYLEIRPYSEGMAAARKFDEFGEPKWGYLDPEGKVVIPFVFTKEPGPFFSGLALVEPLKKDNFDFAYIDKKGDVKFSVPQNLTPIAFYHAAKESASEIGYFVKGYAFWYDKAAAKTVMIKPDGSTLFLNDFIKNNNGTNNYYPRVIQGRMFVAVGNKLGEFSMDGTLLLSPVLTSIHADNWAKYYYGKYYDENKNETEGVINNDGVFILVKAKPESTKW